MTQFSLLGKLWLYINTLFLFFISTQFHCKISFYCPVFTLFPRHGDRAFKMDSGKMEVHNLALQICTLSSCDAELLLAQENDEIFGHI